MSSNKDVTEGVRLLMSFLKDHEEKEVWFLLTDGFISGILVRAPETHHEEFTLINATRQSPNGEKQELDQVLIHVSQIYGWSGNPLFP